jgi:threonine dehydrogenase-like Zn-dependent dehydrogenase
MVAAAELSFTDLIDDQPDTFPVHTDAYSDASVFDAEMCRTLERTWMYVGHDHRSVVPAIEMIRSGRHPLHLLTTHRFPLEATHEALDLAGRRTDPSAIHVSVLPEAMGATP